ncbi:hypothetical protein [uncultured Maribacter sp.]|uniref:hypothetical protein n=1 Tax=uncultured Maribacter sp. TaxID=431308 RepID=UPI002616CE44|nr:hypothetical protein [uncultured Maribacter sp.]
MLKKIILHIIIFTLFFSCKEEKSLFGHWHEHLNGNKDFDNCYIISDSTISINKLTSGATFQLEKTNPSQIWEFIKYSDKIVQSHLITDDKVTFMNNTEWIRQPVNSETFLNDFSAGYKVNIHPFKSAIEKSESIAFNNGRLNILLACGKLKNQHIDTKNGFLKNQFYFQINDKITREYEDLLEYINCTHCQLDKINLYVNMDKNTPIELKRKLDSALNFLNLKQSQVFYLKADLKKSTNEYQNTTANNGYSK